MIVHSTVWTWSLPVLIRLFFFGPLSHHRVTYNILSKLYISQSRSQSRLYRPHDLDDTEIKGRPAVGSVFTTSLRTNDGRKDTQRYTASSCPYLFLYVTFSLAAQTVWAINMIVPVILHALRNKVCAHIWTFLLSMISSIAVYKSCCYPENCQVYNLLLVKARKKKPRAPIWVMVLSYLAYIVLLFSRAHCRQCCNTQQTISLWYPWAKEDENRWIP